MRAGRVNVDFAHRRNQDPHGAASGAQVLPSLAGQLVEGIGRRGDLYRKRGRKGLNAALRIEKCDLGRRDERDVGGADGVLGQTEPLFRDDGSLVLVSFKVIHQTMSQQIPNPVVEIACRWHFNQFSLVELIGEAFGLRQPFQLVDGQQRLGAHGWILLFPVDGRFLTSSGFSKKWENLWAAL